MKNLAPLLAIITATMLLCGGCASVKLGGGDSSKDSSAAIVDPKQVPPINGEWRITFVYQDNPYESDIVFSQKGTALAGEGKDGTGVPFMIQNGVVQGNQVKFTKRYVDADPSKPPVEYSGEISYQEDEGYKGWSMGGHYKTTLSNGTVIDDKWIALSKEAEALFAKQPQSAPPQAQSQPVQQPPLQQEVPVAQEPATVAGAGSEDGAPNISGQYNVSYKKQFKKIFTKLWLAQDGHHVTGHGVDTNTNEKFTVTKGWYHYPKITIVCQYAKGTGAASSRNLTVQAQVSGGPTMHGETEFGGDWEARIVR